MSRIGKKPIPVPEKTTVAVGGGRISITGPLGELSRPLKPVIAVTVEGSVVKLSPNANNMETRALWGTYNAHISNMIKGVHQAFEKKLVIEGIGYKAEVKGDTVHLSVGFSHPVLVKIPPGLKVTSEKGVIAISGIDKELVGQFAARVRHCKKPEPYKGKGIRYEKEIIRRKQGKKTA